MGCLGSFCIIQWKILTQDAALMTPYQFVDVLQLATSLLRLAQVIQWLNKVIRWLNKIIHWLNKGIHWLNKVIRWLYVGYKMLLFERVEGEWIGVCVCVCVYGERQTERRGTYIQKGRGKCVCVCVRGKREEGREM